MTTATENGKKIVRTLKTGWRVTKTAITLYNIDDNMTPLAIFRKVKDSSVKVEINLNINPLILTKLMAKIAKGSGVDAPSTFTALVVDLESWASNERYVLTADGQLVSLKDVKQANSKFTWGSLEVTAKDAQDAFLKMQKTVLESGDMVRLMALVTVLQAGEILPKKIAGIADSETQAVHVIAGEDKPKLMPEFKA